MPLVGAHALEVVLGAGRDDGVVVRDLLVVDHAAERQVVEPGHVARAGRVLGLRADELGGRLDLADLVARQEARVGTRVGERLVLLVEPLRGGQRAAGREAVERVRVALQRGQVVEELRLLALFLLLQLGDLAGAVLDVLDDLRGLVLGIRLPPM